MLVGYFNTTLKGFKVLKLYTPKGHAITSQKMNFRMFRSCFLSNFLKEI